MQPWNPDSGLSYEDWQRGYNVRTYGDERGHGYGDKPGLRNIGRGIPISGYEDGISKSDWNTNRREMSLVDPYQGRRRWNNGRIEVDMAPPPVNCLVPPCPGANPGSNWQPDPRFETMEIDTDKHGLPNPDGTWGRNQTLPWDGTPGEMQPLGARIGNFLNNYEVAGTYGQQKDMPDYVYESLRRQMGPGYGFGDYKTEDMKNVINWNAGRLRI